MRISFETLTELMDSGDLAAEEAWSDYADALVKGWPLAYWTQRPDSFRVELAWNWRETDMEKPPFSLTWEQVAALMLGLEHGEVAWQGVWDWDEIAPLAKRGLIDKDHKLTRLGRIAASRIADKLG